MKLTKPDPQSSQGDWSILFFSIVLQLLAWAPIFELGYRAQVRPMLLPFAYISSLIFIGITLLRWYHNSVPHLLHLRCYSLTAQVLVPLLLPIVFIQTGGLSFEK